MQIVGRIYRSCFRAEVSFPPGWLWGEESFSAFRGLSHSFCYGSLHIRNSNEGLSSSQALNLSCWSLIFSLPLCLWLHLNLPVSVQFGCSVVSYSLWPHGLQYARLPCPSPTPGACSTLRNYRFSMAKDTILLLLLLSRFSCVRLCAAP